MPAHLSAKEGPFKGLVLRFDEGEEWTIGRDPDEADFVIDDPSVSRKHALFIKTPEGISIQNLSRLHPTQVNGHELEEELLLEEGDEIIIGDTLFLFSEREIPPQSLEGEPTLKEQEEPSAYDTIFEEGARESDLPFHLIPDTPLLLKVISGPNAGAEIGIETDRSYVLGKDPNTCDIVFQDLSVSRNHARLHVDSDGIVDIEDLGSKNGTLVNGEPILEKTILTPQDVISLGTTLFLFIDREAPQETIFAAPPAQIEEERAPELLSEEEAAQIAQEAEPLDWKKTKIPSKYLVGAGGFFLVLFIVFMSFFSLFKSSEPKIAEIEPKGEVAKALSSFPGIQYSFNPTSGRLFLVGHVSTAIQFQEMHYRLSQIPFITGIEDTVVIDETLCKMINDLLSTKAAWRAVNVSAPDPGRFVINGYVQTAAEAEALREYLLSNFPYTDKLTNRIAIDANLQLQIASLITAHGFSTVTFQLSQGEVVLSGIYSEDREKEYEKFLKQLHTLQGIHAVKNFATPTSHHMARIDLTEQYQISGSSLLNGRGYSAIINGKVFTQGEIVDGMKITSIETNRILLEKDGLKYTINYTPGR